MSMSLSELIIIIIPKISGFFNFLVKQYDDVFVLFEMS